MQRPLRQQAARNATAEELSRKIRHWTTVDMCITTEDFPSDTELKMFLSRDNMDAWLYITEHIRSPRITEVVRGNLLLQSTGSECGGDLEKAQMLDCRLQLQQEMNSTQVAISQLEKDISRLHAEISQAEEKNAAVREGTKELVGKSYLTATHTVKCAEEVQVTKEFSSRILARLQPFKYNCGSETTYFARTTKTAVEGGSAVTQSVMLEPACTKQLRNVCEQMESLLHLHVNIHSEGTDRQREKVWSQLEQLMAAHPPAEVMNSLALLTVSCAEELREHTSAIDLQRDSQELQYRCVGGEVMCDPQEGEESSLLRSVHDHIQGLQLDHIQRAVRSEAAKRNATVLENRLTCLRNELDDRITKSAGTVEELVRVNLHLDLELAGCEGALETLRVACTGLGEAKELCASVGASLQKKRDQIREFTQLSESKQALIQYLVKHNSGARQHLCDQQTKLVLYIKQNVCAHELGLLPLVASLTEGVPREMTLFSPLSLHKLGCAVSEKSISLLTTVTWLHPVLRALGIQTYISPDQVLLRTMKMLEKAETLRDDIEGLKHELKVVRSSQAIQANVKDIVAKVEQYDNCRVEERLPLLQACMLAVSQSLAHCVQAQHTLEEWWQQPAQCLTPWITYEGMDVARWIEQWDCLATKLRQLTT